MHGALAEDPGDDIGHVVHVEVHLRAAACQYNCQKKNKRGEACPHLSRDAA